MKNRLLWLIIAVILVSLLPAAPVLLTDIETGRQITGFAAQWPFWRYLIEPLAGPAEYLLGFSRYVFQLLSWMVWLGLAAALAGFLRKRTGAQIVRSLSVLWLSFVSVVILFLLAPLPAPKLVAPRSYTVVDLHSHTYYSHDTVMSPKESLWFHQRLGFDRFFDTEHGHTDGFAHFPESARLRTVFPGMQVSTKERVSLLVLADRPFNGAEFRDKTVKEVIDLAHKYGFVAISPHWWKWRYFTWEQLRDLGIDGFEVYNAGYRNFPEQERRKLIAFCRENNLLMLGTTDWHGWGYMSNIWTVLPMSRVDDKPGESLFAALRGRHTTTVLVLRRAERLDTLRYLFEPFFGVYYYFGGMSFFQLCGWMLWILAVRFIVQRPFAGRLPRLVPPTASALFLLLSAYAFLRWLPLRPESELLGKTLAPVLLALSVFWFLLWRRGKKPPSPTR